MEYMGFVFGIFGLMAYLQISALKKRVDDLEREMTKIEGTEHAQKQTSLRSVVRKWIGEEVILELKDKIALDMPSGAEGIELIAGRDDGGLADSQKDAVEALVALGYSATEASRAVRACKPDPDMNADEILKKALPFLL